MPQPKPPCPNVATRHSNNSSVAVHGAIQVHLQDVVGRVAAVPLHKLAYNERPNPIMKKPRKKRSDAKANQIVDSGAPEVTEDLSFLIPVAPATVAMTTETEKKGSVVGDVMIGIDDLGRTGLSRARLAK